MTNLEQKFRQIKIAQIFSHKAGETAGEAVSPIFTYLFQAHKLKIQTVGFYNLHYITDIQKNTGSIVQWMNTDNSI